MGATFSRVKNWTAEVLSNTDLNTEIDNILNNFGPDGVDDYSTNATEMRTQTNPGGSGSESLATSLAGELARLRYVIQRLIGGSTTYWYEAPSSTIGDLVAAIGTGLPTNRIVSGRTTGNSSQLCALIPSGTTASLTLSASVTPFVYYVGGTQYSITANQTLTGLSLAAGSNTTCLVNNTAAAGQQWTRISGMYGTKIEIDSPDSGITSLIGQIAGFKTGNEYFTAYVDQSAALTNAWRGGMFNQSANNVTAVGLSNNDVIQLMKLAWIFANTSSSLAVTYTNPTISAEQPSSPNTGDYWFDLATTAWKTFNSTTWVAANATLIGLSMQDTVACVAARTFDSYKAMSPLNTVQLDLKQEAAGTASVTVVQATEPYAEVSVFGSTNRFLNTKPVWDITADLKSGVTETLSRTYYLYMKESGLTVISDEAPLPRKDLQGLYHPGETWRALGSVYNNASTHFETPVNTFRDQSVDKIIMGDAAAYNATAFTSGTYLANLFPGRYFDLINSSENFTIAQGSYQPNNTITLTPGIWKVSGIMRFAWTGTAAVGAQAIAHVTTASGTAASTTFMYNDDIVGIGSVVTNNAYCKIINVPVNVTTATNYFLKGAVVGTAGAVYSIASRFIAERINDLTGIPK